MDLNTRTFWGHQMALYIAGACGLLFFIVMAVTALFIARRKRQRQHEKNNEIQLRIHDQETPAFRDDLEFQQNSIYDSIDFEEGRLQFDGRRDRFGSATESVGIDMYTEHDIMVNNNIYDEIVPAGDVYVNEEQDGDVYSNLQQEAEQQGDDVYDIAVQADVYAVPIPKHRRK